MVKHQAEPAGVARELLGFFHLPEDLRLAQHHRVEAAGDAERVPHGIHVRQHVRVAVQFVEVQLSFGGDELAQRLLRDIGLFDGAIKLGPVARGDDRGLADPAAGRSAQAIAQATDRCAHFVGQEGDSLTHCERRSGVVEPEGKELHRRSRRPLPRAWTLCGTAEL